MNPNPDIHPGDFVKIIRGSERFWVRYTGKSGGKAHGVVDNELLNTSIHGLRRGSKVSFRPGEVIDVMRGNPAVSAEQYRLAQAVLSGTARDAHMPVSVAREIVDRTPAKLRSEYSKYTNPGGVEVELTKHHHFLPFSTKKAAETMKRLLQAEGVKAEVKMVGGEWGVDHTHANPFYGTDLDLETDMAPAWMYYDSKEARDAAARMYEGRGKEVVLGHSMFGFKEGGGKKWRLRGLDHRGNPIDLSPGEIVVKFSSHRSRDKAFSKLDREPTHVWSMYRDVGTGGSYVVTESEFEKIKHIPGVSRTKKLDKMHKGNPQPAADDMYAAFHGEPSDETIEIADEEHYHSHLAAFGELVELKVKLVNGGTAVIGFETGASDEEENPKQKWLLPYKRGKKNYEDVGYLPYALQHDVGFGGDKMYRPVKYENGQITVMSSELAGSHYDRYSRKSAIDAVKYLAAGMGKQNPATGNPFWPFNSFTHTTIYHVGTGEKYKASGTHKGYTLYRKLDTDEFLVPALDKDSRFDTLKDAKEFVNSWTKHQKNPKHRGPFHGAGKLLDKGTRAVSRPLDDFTGAVGKVGGYLDDELGRVFNPGPNTDFSFYHAAQEADEVFQSALEKEYGKRAGDMRYQSSKHPAHIKRLAKIKHEADERWLNEMRRKKNPSGHDTGPTYLTSNEDGTQLFIVGGDQLLDLPGLGITGTQAEKELVTVGHVTNIVYHAHKIFSGKREEYDYTHKFSEDSGGPLPELIYDRINQQLKLSGGMYKIDRPLVGTSPGIED